MNKYLFRYLLFRLGLNRLKIRITIRYNINIIQARGMINN